MEHLLIFLIVIFIYPSFQSIAEAKNIGGFTIDIVHRDSKLSPFYNDSATLRDLSTHEALSSIARANHFRTSSNLLGDNKASIVSPVIPNGGGYLMKLSIGSPPVETYAIADTGSDLVWVQCKPCDQCYPQDSPIFDPAKSSSYQVLACDTNYCQNLPKSSCGVDNKCQYSYGYGDRSQTNGDLASETITFDSTGGQPVSFPSSVFGCGHQNGGSFTSRGSGLVGLGGGPLSLISQLGEKVENRFSYCLLPRTSNSASKLKFGSDAVLSGGGVVSTPFSSDDKGTFYYLTLEGITVGDRRIPNSETGGSNGNIIIDSGTTLTMLESNFYQQVEDAVKGAVSAEPVQQEAGDSYSLCYDKSSFGGGGASEISMVFHFTGADVTLKSANIFRDTDDSVTCLAILPTEQGSSLFGNVAQVNFEVEYDLGKKQVSFAPADCTRY